MKSTKSETFFWLSIVCFWLAFCAFAIGVMQDLEEYVESPRAIMRRVRRAQGVTFLNTVSLIKAINRQIGTWRVEAYDDCVVICKMDCK